MDDTVTCICQSAKRLVPFLDTQTVHEHTLGQRPSVHVRTTDLNIVQHPLLRNALKLGLNHIPLRPILFNDAIKVVIEAFR